VHPYLEQAIAAERAADLMRAAQGKRRARAARDAAARVRAAAAASSPGPAETGNWRQRGAGRWNPRRTLNRRADVRARVVSTALPVTTTHGCSGTT
jgi:hypothetical protein